MKLALLLAGVFTLAATQVFGASTLSYSKDGSVDSINLDLSVSESTRRKDGALVFRAEGELEKQPIRLTLVISDRWTVWRRPTKGGAAYQADMEILADGVGASTLDEVVWRSFKRETKCTLFCSTYVGFTSARRDDLDRKKIRFWVSDCALCGDLEIAVGLDVKRKSLKLALFEVSYGRTYPDRVE